MNKTQLVDAVAAATGMSKAQADAAVSATFTSIIDAMKAGDKVQIVGFGTFASKDVPEKEYANHFGDGEKVVKPACKKPTFTAGKGLKDALNA